MASVDLCQQLVRAPSLPGDEARAAGVVVRAFQALGYDHVATDEYGTVTGTRRGAAPGRTLLLDAHLDVVAVTDPEQWRHAPFGGEIAEGRVWGRGACDDKGVLAAMLCGAGLVPRDAFAGEIVVSASVCEETLTGAALAHVLDRHPPDVVVVGEPTDLRLAVAQKGRAGLVVEAHGKSAHTSRPELGDNAVYKMIEAIRRLRAVALRSDAELGSEIMELTEIESEPRPGAGFVPSGCRAWFVNRTLPGATREDVLTRWRGALAGLDGVSIDFDQLTQRCYTGATLTMPDFIPGWRTSANEPWSARILEGVRRAGLEGKTFAAPYGTNASISARVRGIPSFIFGPGSIEQAHVVDEWIAIDELRKGERAYAEIVAACLGTGDAAAVA